MAEKKSLYEQLCSYEKSDYYPYHMPGHKRKQLGKLPPELLGADITEIEGFDNLHQPEGILRDLQIRTSELYGAEESFYLINGSTCGILSAVSAALPEGGHLLMARGCHKSAYHAVYLRKLRVSYLYPEQVRDFDFSEAVTAKQVELALESAPDIGAVLIVSPTYEGRIADIRGIADVVHAKGIPLIVDEAHGAHLGFAEGFAEGSCTQGADLVVHSVHKTLPALTQTALLHVCGNRIERERLKRFLHIYQSSSPSYLLLSGIEDSLEIVAKQGAERFCRFRKRYRKMTKQLQACRVLRFVSWEDVEKGRQDIGKLVISAGEAGVSGQWIFDFLREKYHLQCEMAAGNYCLAMFTLADDEEAYTRMEQALLEIDSMLEKQNPVRQNPASQNLVKQNSASSNPASQNSLRNKSEKTNPSIPDLDYPLAQAWDMPCEMTKLSDAVGRSVGEFVNLYPPGIPLLVPGEILSRELYEQILHDKALGICVQGIEEQDGEIYIKTIKM